MLTAEVAELIPGVRQRVNRLASYGRPKYRVGTGSSQLSWIPVG